MIRRPPRSTRTDTLVPYTTLFRSRLVGAGQASGYRPSASIPYDRAVTDHDRTIPLRYSTPAMLGHWLVVLLIVSTYCVAWTMVSLRISPTQLRLFNDRKSTRLNSSH